MTPSAAFVGARDQSPAPATLAGAVMIGRAPDYQPFRDMFNWRDAVIAISQDGPDAADVLSRLRAEPERIREISRRNAQNALRRHGWSHRWKRILDIAGLPATAGMHHREETLNALAEHGRHP